MLRNYVLTYNPAQIMDMLPQLIAFIQSNGLTYQFAAPFLGCVFIKSNYDLAKITESYNSFFFGNPFVICEVQSSAMGGRLDKWLWDWLNNPNPPALPYTPIGPK